METVLQNREHQRIVELHGLGILDSGRDEGLDGLCALACDRFQVSIAAISLIDRDRQWFKAIRGLATRETPREQAFCAHTILSDDVLVVPDARADARFAANPLVNGDPGIRFYAGAPLVLPSGMRPGSFCLIDRKPRDFTDQDRQMLASFATVVVSKILRSLPGPN